MVFESVVVDVLNRLLGDYFENVDPSQLKLGIWGGDVVLNNLMLKQSAFDDLGPFRVSVGKLGNLTMKIPWTSLYTAPVIMNLEDLHLLVMPSTSVKYDAKVEEDAALAAKRKEIERIEEARIRELNRDKQQVTADDTFTEKLIAQIIKNVQIEIKSIHIRYEDFLSSPDRPFSFGAILRSFSVQTTDANWKPQIITEIVHVIHKLADLDGLSIYWNTNSRMLSTSDLPQKEILEEMKEMVYLKNHRFILQPIVSQAKLKLVPNPERGTAPFSLPKMYIDLILKELALGMTNYQFQDLMRLMEALDYMSRAQQYRKYRPMGTAVAVIQGNAKQWWKFAYRCIVEEEVRRKRLNWDWNHIKQHRELCRVYAKAYYEKRTSKKPKPENEARVAHCENVLDVFNIALVRKQVEFKIERKGAAVVEPQPQKGGWLSWNSWFGSGEGTSENAAVSEGAGIAQKFEAALTPEEKKKLYDAIDYSEDDQPLVYPKTFQEYVLNFNLDSLTLTVKDEESTVQGSRILHSSIQNLVARFATRPAQKGMNLDVDLSDMFATGVTLNEATAPTLFKVNKLVGAKDLLLKVGFQTNPVDSDVQTKINVKAQPVEIIYHASTVQAIQKCFALPSEMKLQRLQAAAVTTIEEWRLQSASGLQYMMEKRGEMDLQIEMKAPILIIPQDGRIDQPGSVLVINLGSLSVKSKPRAKTNVTVRTSFEEVKKLSYDKFFVTLRDFQVLLTLKDERYDELLGKIQATSPTEKAAISEDLYLIHSKELLVEINQSLVKDDPRFAWMKVYVHLPLLDVGIAENRLIELITLMATLPLPKQDQQSEGELFVKLSELPVVNEYAAISKLTYTDALSKSSKKLRGTEVVNFDELVLSVDVDRVSVKVTKSKGERETLATLDLIRLSTQVTSKTFGTGIIAKIGGLSFEMAKHSYPELQGPLYLLKTLMTEGIDKPLLIVDMFSITPNCPPNLASAVKQHIKADISSLDVILHLQALQSIMSFYEEISRNIMKAIKVEEESLDPDFDTLSVASGRFSGTQKGRVSVLEARRNAVAKKHNNPDDILLQIDANLDHLSLQLSTETLNIVKIVLSKMEAKFSQKIDVTDIVLELSDLSVLNLNKASSYQKLVQVDADKVVHLRVKMFEEGRKGSRFLDMDFHDMEVILETGSPRMVYLGPLVSDILVFLDTFQAAKDAMMEASAHAAGLARENMESAYTSTSKILLNIVLRAPKIVIPRNDNSDDAIVADLGLLKLKNQFKKLSVNNGDKAVIDCMHLTLTNMKAFRIWYNKETKVRTKVSIFDPITLSLDITRNLCTEWYHKIPGVKVAGALESASVKLSSEDYSGIMISLNENINAPGNLKAVVQAHPQITPVSSVRRNSKRDSHPVAGATGMAKVKRAGTAVKAMSAMKGKQLATVDEAPPPRFLQMEISFRIGAMALKLFTSDIKKKTQAEIEHDPSASFADLEITAINFQLNNWSNADMQVNITVAEVTLQDSRPGSHSIKHVIQRKTHVGGEERKPLVYVAYNEEGDKNNGPSLIIETEGLVVVLCVEYLLQLSTFFVVTDISVKEKGAQKHVGNELVSSDLEKQRRDSVVDRSGSPSDRREETKVTSSMFFEMGETEIILVEDMENKHNNALLLNASVNMKMISTGEKSNIMGTVGGVRLYTCNYSSDSTYQKMAEVISPMSMTVVVNMSKEGIMVDLNISNFFARLTAGTLDLLIKISTGVSINDSQSEEGDTAQMDRLNFWDTKEIKDLDFWFLNPEVTVEVGTDIVGEKQNSNDLVLEEVQKKEGAVERVILESGTIVITFESGTGVTSVPLLLIETDLDMQAFDWSSKLQIAGKIKLEAAYYNTKYGIWEYMIEPVECRSHGKVSHKPWEMLFEYNSVPEVPADTEDDSKFMGITLQSNDLLEVTVSKSGLEVLMLLSGEFQATVKSLVVERDVSISPYTIQNNLGVPIRVEIKDSQFVCLAKKSSDDYVTIDHGNSLKLGLKESLDLTKHSSVLREQDGWEERILKLEVPDFHFNAQMPVNRAEKRFYPLGGRTEFGETYGILCDIVVKDCSKLMTVRGIVQITNELPVAVDVFTLYGDNGIMKQIGTIEANATFDVPLSYVYTKTCEFYFAPRGYKVASLPFTWSTLVMEIKSLTYLVCEPEDATHSLYMMVVGEVKQALYQGTKRKTLASKSCSICLRPPIIINNLLPVPIGYYTDEDPVLGVATNGSSIAATNIQVTQGLEFKIHLKIESYQNLSWTATVDMKTTTPELSAWDFTSSDGNHSMCLGIHKEQLEGSNLFLHVYCPFWMVNQTGIDLFYKGDVRDASTIHHERASEHPLMFSFKGKSFFAKKKAMVRFKDSDWSEKFSLDVAGSSGTVTCKSPRRDYQVGLGVVLMSWGLTKSIVFSPRFYLISHCTYELNLRETQPGKPLESGDFIKLLPNSCISFWPNLQDPYLIANIEGTAEYSKLVRYDHAHHTLLKLVNKYGGVHIDVHVSENKTVITFNEFIGGHAPALLVNHTQECPIEFFEKGSTCGGILLPGRCQYVAWEDPMGTRTIEWGPAAFQRKITYLDKLHSDGMGKFPWIDDNNHHHDFYWISFLDGLQRVLLFTADEELIKYLQAAKESDRLAAEYVVMFHGLGLSLVDGDKGTEILYLRIASSDITWQAAKPGKTKRYKPISGIDNTGLEVAYQNYLNEKAITPHVKSRVILDTGIEVDFALSRMIKPVDREIRRVFQTGIWVHYKYYTHAVHIHAKLFRIQIDNQLPDCAFPVILAPVLPPKSITTHNEPAKPFAEVSIMQRVTAHSAVTQYKYFKVLIQEFVIRADMNIISAVFDLFSTSPDVKLQKAEEYYEKDFQEVCTPVELVFARNIVSQGQKHFYDYLHFSPLKIHLSFSMGSGAQFSNNFLNLLTQSVGVTLTEVQDVIFKLACLEIQHEILTGDQIFEELMNHYKSQALKQLYVLVLGLDVIGNPYGLVVGVTQGVEAFFYEPLQGAIQGPGEFAEGLLLGCKALVGHTVGGAAGAVSRITGTLGKGMAALTLDEEFKQKRRENLTKRPHDIAEGLARSGKGLAMGFFDGITGVVTQPIKGAQQDGFEGFLKGMGKGAIGLFIRPATGIVDFTSGSFDAVRRATSVSDDLRRLRPPRRVSTDSAIQPYISHEAEGLQLLQELEKGKYVSTDQYVAHALVNPHGVYVLLLTNKRLFYLKRDDIFGGWTVIWVHLWGEFSGVPVIVEKGLCFTLAPKDKKFKMLRKSTEEKLIVRMHNPDACTWILSKIESAMKIEAGIKN